MTPTARARRTGPDRAPRHARVRPRRRLLRAVLLAVAALLLLLAGGGAALWLAARDALGGRVEGARLARAERSPQWRDGQFRNRLPRVDGPALRMLGAFLFGGSEHRAPDAAPPVVTRTRADYAAPPASGLRATWLGHSTLLLEIDGRRVLVDPVWGERVSPFTFAGPRRFYAPPLPLAELPPVDAVVISHDHYDHLDVPTVRALAARGARFVVPLGVGAHLRRWGVAERDVVELDWWEADTVAGLTLTATPARHFSGRGLGDAGRTLWAGWSIAGARHRVYYSGDTALDDAMVEIGARLGPFDLTMIEVGAYDALWPDVHLGPEQAVRAHRLVRGDVLLPVHWGLFDLALHGWTEPMERVLAAAAAEGVRVAAPRPGDRVEPAALGAPVRWWPAVPWRTVREAPVWSTAVEHLVRSAAVAPR
jgi:L-ascorbate metabolism protein UlaG (beta-lactamase superfamily)